MNYFLGVDIGTTSVKAVAFDGAGEVLVARSVGYELFHPEPGFCEQNPDEIFEAVLESIENVLSQLSPGVPVLVSFSAMMHSLIALDEQALPLTNCIIWADNRASAIAAMLKDTVTGRSFYQATGVPVHAMSPFCKLLWLKENNPVVFYKAHKFIGIKEYVFYKLFGTYVVDTAVASTTGLLNLQQLQWDETVLHYVGISSAKLSEVKDTKAMFYYTPAEDRSRKNILLPEDVPFIIGSSDGALANLGSGAITDDSMAITIGTSSAVRKLTNHPCTDKQMRTFCYHAKDGFYINGGASNNGAVVLQWLRNSILQTNETLEELLSGAEGIPAGSDDLLFLPFILGERAPIWNSYATGSFFGLTINHTKAHLVRAAVEGIVFCLYNIGRVLEEKNEIAQIHASGGFAQSTLWLQILADVFNKTVVVSDAKESSALGAVMLGTEALNIQLVMKRSNIEIYQPDYTQHEQYRIYFQKFERIYELVKSEYIMQENTLIKTETLNV